MSKAFLDAVAVRRSHYALSKASPINTAAITEIVQKVVRDTPSAFNSQSGRAVVVTGSKSDKVWEIVKVGYIATLGDDQTAIAAAEKKISEYSAGYGSVLFFEDEAVLDGFVKKIPGLKDLFPVWSQNSTGMAQFNVWTALSAEGLGCSLQHHGQFVPGVTETLAKEFGLPTSWKNTAILPFGTPTGPPGQSGRDKTYEPIEGRVLTFSD